MIPAVKLRLWSICTQGDWIAYHAEIDGRYAFDVAVHSMDKESRIWVGKKHTRWSDTTADNLKQESVYQLNGVHARMIAEFLDEKWRVIPDVGQVTTVICKATYDIMLNLYIPID